MYTNKNLFLNIVKLIKIFSINIVKYYYLLTSITNIYTVIDDSNLSVSITYRRLHFVILT